MKIILAGATGFAGGEVLRQALDDAAITQVTVLTRRPTGMVHGKLRELVLGDFLDYSGVDLSGFDACIWCLGVSQARVSEEAYVRITFGYTMAAATAMFAANPPLRFCFVSGRSADPGETASALFARIKGRTERALSELGADVVNFRPGYIRASAQSGPRKDLARLAAPLGALITLFNADFSVDCDQLARCLLDVAKQGSRQKRLDNQAIRSWKSRAGIDAAPQPTQRVKPPRRLARASLAAGALMTALLGAVVGTGCTAFGDAPEGERLTRARQSPEWHDGHFENPQPIWSDTRNAWFRFAFGSPAPGVQPELALPIVHTDAAALAVQPASGLRVTWFGHSSALLEIDGARVLVDPLWGERASPVGWAGPKRWYAPPLALDALPGIDAVVISHDHYDHLDQATIIAMKSWRTVFVVPLGVGAHLSRWGIPETRIIELDWWQSTRVAGIELVATPARHASGRTGTRSNKTLWAGYAFVGPQHRAWYSGDTGFHDGLARIGERLGPFDLTLVEAGQYDANWPDTHLGPELAVEAHRQVRGKVMIPVHWGLLKLGNHGWTEPVERVLAVARCRGVRVLTPRPGESIEPVQHAAIAPWWPALPWQPAEAKPVISTQRGLPSDRVRMEPCLKRDSP